MSVAFSPAEKFHWVDYVLFSLSLSLGLVIGIISLLTKGKQKDSSEYLLGGKSLNVFAVGSSLLASGLNAVFLLGGIAEVYYRGAIYGLVGLGSVPTLFITVFISVPLWRQLNVTTVFEYLEKRYDSVLLRLWGALNATVTIILFLAIVFYVPAMSLSQVTGVSIHVSIVVCGVVCSVYTVMGGLRAVVWTDCIQTIIMILGLLVICVMGSVQAGGLTHMYNTAKDLGRFNFNNFDPDPRERHTVWGLIIGNVFTLSTTFFCSQVHIQRILSVKDTQSAQWAVVISMLIYWLCVVLVVSVGITAVVHYKDCDPLAARHITAPDQLLPYFFMELLGDYHGLPGLFISAIFAAALSTVSSMINSLAAIFLEAFIKPFMNAINKPMAAEKEHIYAKVSSAIIGLLSIAASYLAPLMGPSIIQIPITIFGATGGPAFSSFFLGFFVPWANKWGAFGGNVVGLMMTLWISFGSIAFGKKAFSDNLPLGMCLLNETMANISLPTTVQGNITESSFQGLYDLSYVWIAAVGVLSSIIGGVIISALFNLCGFRQDISGLDPHLLFSAKAVCACCYHEDKNDIEDDDGIKFCEADELQKFPEKQYVSQESDVTWI